MDTGILLAFGGIGLFLLGMTILTEGLRALAANRMRRMLVRTTKTPLRGVFSGALTTALIQSSSATTVMAVGFVGAGLMSFSQGLGIIFGANIGTTATGWIIAIFGFKVDLGLIASPLLLAGILLKMFAQGNLRKIGWVLAGFSLLFLGISAMQQGVEGLEGILTPDDFPADTLIGRFELVLLGAAITALTQSSSAGLATALVALATGSITFAQAAALVIGMNVGTTVTALLATLGGSTGSRRTGYSHLLYNVITAAVAFFLVTPYTALVGGWLDGGGNAQIALAAFHTLFNVLGVLLFLPFIRPFERLLRYLVPSTGPQLLQRLDEGLLQDPAAAVDAVAATIRDILLEYATILDIRLAPGAGPRTIQQRLAEAGHALDRTRSYLSRIHTGPDMPRAHARHLDTVHALDHLYRLAHRCQQDARIAFLQQDAELSTLAGQLRGAILQLRRNRISEAGEEALNRLQAHMDTERETYRARMVEDATRTDGDTDSLLRKLDSARWLQRVSFHLWRIVHHLRNAEEELSQPRVDPSPAA